MSNYEKLTCTKCSKKYPLLYLPYIEEMSNEDEGWEYSYKLMEALKESRIIEDIEDHDSTISQGDWFIDVVPYGYSFGLLYLIPKPCVHCGVIDHWVDLSHLSDELSDYLEQNFTYPKPYIQTPAEFSHALDSKLPLGITKHGRVATCVPCTEQIIRENKDPSEEEGY